VEGVQVTAILQKQWFMKMRKINFFYFIAIVTTQKAAVMVKPMTTLFHLIFPLTTALSVYLSLQT
jgi:hypothetical protein